MKNSATDSKVSRADVVFAFELILGRTPESKKVIRDHQLKSIGELGRTLLSSLEFSDNRLQETLVHDEWLISEVENTLVDGERLRFWINLSDRYVSRGIRRGEYEKAELTFMGRHLKEGDVVFDIGANLGWYSIHAASVLGGTGRVVSFEANPKTFEYFEKNIIENSMERNIDAKFGALWDESCSEVLLVPEEMPFNPGSAFVKSEKSHASQQGEVIVSAMQLSTLDLPPANFIKIDVEGAEYRALAPYIDVLKETHPIIMSELYPRQLELVSGVSVDEYVQMFVDIGYQVEDLSGCVLTKSIIQNMAYDSPHTIVFKNSESDKAV